MVESGEGRGFAIELLPALLEGDFGDVGFEVNFFECTHAPGESVVFCEVDRPHAAPADDVSYHIAVTQDGSCGERNRHSRPTCKGVRLPGFALGVSPALFQAQSTRDEVPLYSGPALRAGCTGRAWRRNTTKPRC